MSTTDESRRIGQNFKARRLALGLTQKELAEQSGTGRQTIIRFETHGSIPYHSTLRRWSIRMGVPISQLIDDGYQYDDGQHTGHAN